MFMLAETVGVTLLEPLLAALPTRLQRLRVGLLAAPGRYSARDWAITNLLCHWTGWWYFAIFWKNLGVCGWSPDAFPWNLDNYPIDTSCDDTPQTAFELVAYHNTRWAESDPLWLELLRTFWMPTVGLIMMTGFVLCLSRKLPGWGEPPEDAESTTQPAKPPPGEAKVAPEKVKASRQAV